MRATRLAIPVIALLLIVMSAVIIAPEQSDAEAVAAVSERITEDTEITESRTYSGPLEISEDVFVVVRGGATVTISEDAVNNGTLVVGQGATLKVTGSLMNKGLMTVTGSGSQKALVTVTGSFVNSAAMHIDGSGLLKGDVVAGKDSVTSVSGTVDGTVYTSGVAEIRGTVTGGVVLESGGAETRICGTSSDIRVSISAGRDMPMAVISPSAGHSVTGLVLTSVDTDGGRAMDVSGQVSSTPVSLSDRLRSTITLSGDCRVSDTLILERGTDMVVKGNAEIIGTLDAMYPENTIKVSGKMEVKGVVDTANAIQVSGKLDASRQLIEDDKGDFYRYTEKKSSGGISIDIGVDAILIALIVIVCFLIIALLATDPRLRKAPSVSKDSGADDGSTSEDDDP